MRKISSSTNLKGILFLMLQCLFLSTTLFSQQTSITDYVIFGGKIAASGQTTPLAPGYGVQIGTSSNIQGGSIGSYHLIKSTGATTLGTNVYSGGIIQLAGGNVVKGKITAANQFTLPENLAIGSTILTVGTNSVLGNNNSPANFTQGNIDVNGSVNIGVSGSSVLGKVTIPSPAIYTYTGPTPAGTLVKGTPTLPILPKMPEITAFPNFDLTKNITATTSKAPGNYGNVNLSGNTTLTLTGPGTYVFNAITSSGPNNQIIFDFQNSPSGNFLIYVWKDVNLYKTSFTIVNGGSANRIYTEIQGTGSTNSADNTAAFYMSNGSNGSGNTSGWMGTLWAPYAAIKIGTPNGPSMSLMGALYSGTQINIVSGITMTFAPFNFCGSITADAGKDKALEFTGLTKLKGTSSTIGAIFNWTAINGGVISSPLPYNTAEITVSSQGTYILTATDPLSGCSAADTVEVASKLNSVIGSELQSVFENKTTDNTFFDIKDGYIKIDIIANEGRRTDVLNALLESITAKPGLKDTVPNGLSAFTITGRFLVDSLQKLNSLGNIINYARPYYRAILFTENVAGFGDTSKTGLIRSEGDTTMRTHLVRSGYGIYGDGIKLGVMSDSYSSLTSGTTATKPYQPTRISPYIISPTTLDTIGTVNPIAQTFNTNTPSIDVANRDLPPNVQELPAFPVSGTDEGRAMLQIVHDVAPGAELYFRTGFNTAGDFAKGIKELKDAGCNIIVDDITYPTEPFLRDGIVARTVNEVKAAGLTYFTSAGNFANRSYEKVFTPITLANGKVAHNFGGGDAFQKIKLAPGDYTFVFQWVDNIYSLNETVGTVNDLDIYLTKNQDGTGLVGFNRNNLVGDPIEFIPITIPAGDSVEYNVYIVNNTPGATNPRMKYVVFRGNPRFIEFNEGTSTIVGQANADGAIAVGAARYNHVPGHPQLPKKFSGITKPQIESFSSIGGTTVNGTIRLKPDLVGPDGGNTTVKMGQDYPDWALDGFSNFFGTSAAAPHAAAAAALIMEGRKKYLNATTTSPDLIKTLLQTTAVDMDIPGFDFISGRGLVDADSAMRTFAAPRPYSIKLVIPDGAVPGETAFILTVTGQNFSANSEVYYGDIKLVIISVSPDGSTILAEMPKFPDNQAIRVYTAPITVNGDGGFSNSLYFFDADIIVRAVNTSIKYGQAIPVLDTIITVNGIPLEQTTLKLVDIGLDKMKVTTSAPAFGFVGTYTITPSFDPAFMPSADLLKKYNYQFIDAQLSIAKMPLKVTPYLDNKTIVYGQKLGNIQYQYDFEAGNLPSNVEDWREVIKLYHQTILPNNALAVIKDFSKVQSDFNKLTFTDLTNLNMMVTFNALINSGKFIIENNMLKPVADLATLNGFYQVDVASESIYNYLKGTDPAIANLYAANSSFSSKAVLGANALAANTAKAYPNGGGGLAQMVNGMVSEVAGVAGVPVVPIINNNMIQVLNAKIVELVNNVWVPVAANATDSIQIVNKQLAKFVNGVPQVLADGIIVQVNGGGGLAQLVNGGGGLAQMVNGGGGLAQLVNGVVNSQDLVFQNGVVNVVVNGGGGLAQLVNGTLIAFPNGGGGLAQLVNGGGGLAQLVNGGGGLAQLVNGGGGLAQLVNGGGGLAQLVNGGGGGGLAQLVNGGGGLAQLVNGGGGLAQLVNGNVVGAGNSNNHSAVIFDASNINNSKTGNWLGAMYGINMITGLNVGPQKLIPGIFVNPNFDITYGLGDVEITKAPLTVTAKPHTRDYDGTNVSSLVPDIAGLSLTDVVVTAPIQTFDNRNVGTGKVLTPSGLVITDGNGGNNYTLTYVPATGAIGKITATVTAQTHSRVYNGNTSSSPVPVVTGLITPDAIATVPVQSFDTRHVATGKTLTAAGLVINDGNGGGNYNISYVANNTGVISQKAVTVTAVTDSKIYDGSNSSTKSPTVTGIVTPDGVSSAPVQTFDTKDFGSNKVMTATGLIINDGNGGNNYTVGYITNTTGVISKKTITVTADNKSRPYGENNPLLTATFAGFVQNESLLNSGITGAPSLNTDATQTSPVGTYPITAAIGTLVSSNYAFITPTSFVNGVLTIITNSCLITHGAFKNFGNTTEAKTSLWMSMTTKVSGQLNAEGDYLLFKAGAITFNNISSTPLVSNLAVPNGKIITVANISVPKTYFDASTNTWITEVPVGFSSTSDIFVTGAIINSSNGFVKTNNNTSSVLKGIFYSNKYFKDQWAYAIAAYQPQFDYSAVAGSGVVASINGTYRAGTPISQIANLVNGGSGGGGNNYTGSSSSFDNYTACIPTSSASVSRAMASISSVPVSIIPTNGEIEAFPNPANNYIIVSFVPVKTGNYHIALLSIDGKRVAEIDNGLNEAGKKYTKRIDVGKLARGVYMIQLMSKDKVINKKIIINR